MKILDSDLSCRFRQMSFICACFVVLIHSTVSPGLGSWQWWVAFVLGGEGICRVALPFFFLTSGYFLSRHVDEIGWYGRAIRSRLKTLLVPFYFWTIVKLAVTIGIAFCIRVAGYKNYHGNIVLPDFSLDWLLRVVGLDPFANIGVLWYLRAVLMCVLISPLILKLKYVGVVVFSVAYCAFDFFGAHDEGMFNFLEYFMPLRGFLYFSVGLLLARVNLRCCDGRLGWCAFVLGAVLLLVKGFLTVNKILFVGFVDFFMVPLLLVGMWGTVGRIQPRCFLPFMGLSFPVYLIHGHMILFVTIACAMVGASELAKTNIAFMLLKFLSGVVGALLIAKLMRRISLRCANVAFGGRGCGGEGNTGRCSFLRARSSSPPVN